MNEYHDDNDDHEFGDHEAMTVKTMMIMIDLMIMMVMAMMMAMVTWGQDSTTSLKEVSSTCGQSDKSRYYK